MTSDRPAVNSAESKPAHSEPLLQIITEEDHRNAEALAEALFHIPVDNFGSTEDAYFPI